MRARRHATFITPNSVNTESVKKLSSDERMYGLDRNRIHRIHVLVLAPFVPSCRLDDSSSLIMVSGRKMVPGVILYPLVATSLLSGAQAFSAEPKGKSIPEHSRRDALRRVSQGAAAFLMGAPVLTSFPATSLAASVPSSKELERLPLGLARVRYLLDHWDEITSTCGTKIMSDLERKQVIRTEGGGGGFCDRTPLRVQEFLGYKSTEDPLFKADKLMLRAAPLVDPDSFEDYLSLVEKYREKADYGAMMAYTSSWGEANPNGGKEVIDEYLERTKEEVKSTEQLLRQLCAYLDLKDLPPLKGPL